MWNMSSHEAKRPRHSSIRRLLVDSGFLCLGYKLSGISHMNFQCQRKKPPSFGVFGRFFRLCDFDAKEKLTRRSCRCFRDFFQLPMLGAGRFQDQVLLGARPSSAFPALGTHQEPFFLSGECDRNRRLTLA